MSAEVWEAHENFPDNLKPFEAMLGSLRPVASRIDRDRMMYEAGAAALTPAALSISATAGARRPTQWLWPCISAAMLLVSATLGAALMLRNSPIERVVYVSRPAEAPTVVPTNGMPQPSDDSINAKDTGSFRLSEQSNLALRERALRLGVDAIGIPGSTAPGLSTPEAGNRSLLNRMLGT